MLLLYCWLGEIYCKKVDVSLKNMFLRIYFMGGGGLDNICEIKFISLKFGGYFIVNYFKIYILIIL